MRIYLENCETVNINNDDVKSVTFSFRNGNAEISEIVLKKSARMNSIIEPNVYGLTLLERLGIYRDIVAIEAFGKKIDIPYDEDELGNNKKQSFCISSSGEAVIRFA